MLLEDTAASPCEPRDLPRQFPLPRGSLDAVLIGGGGVQPLLLRLSLEIHESGQLIGACYTQGYAALRQVPRSIR